MATIPEDAVIADETDDPDFLSAVRRIILNVVTHHAPAELYVVRVSNWFDYKWLGFGGKVIGAVGKFPAELTIPPFKPSRVLSEGAFSRNPSGEYVGVQSEAKLHIDIPSESNLRRKIQAVSNSGVFIWYSSNSRPNGRGSLMVYRTLTDGADGWYAAFKKTDVWHMSRQQGIGREELEMLSTP
jgi:hypothetical protein